MTTSVAYSETVPESLTRLVLSHLREIPDFPEPGVLFRDITPLLADGGAFTELVDGLADLYRGRIDAVAGLESRGFILAAPLAVSSPARSSVSTTPSSTARLVWSCAPRPSPRGHGSW